MELPNSKSHNIYVSVYLYVVQTFLNSFNEMSTQSNVKMFYSDLL